MTLAEIRAAHPDLFYRQDWFDGQSFMDAEPSEYWRDHPFDLTEVEYDRLHPIRAVDVAAAYMLRPTASMWKRFIWTDDVDRWGNRIYVAGVGQYGCDGFQIHRHLQPSAYWVRALCL